MKGKERSNRTVGTFFIPGVIDTYDHRKDWKYSGWRVVVTDSSDAFLARHLLHLVRS